MQLRASGKVNTGQFGILQQGPCVSNFCDYINPLYSLYSVLNHEHYNTNDYLLKKKFPLIYEVALLFYL